MSVLLPEPDTPVTHTSRLSGICTSMFLRLFSAAPTISRKPSISPSPLAGEGKGRGGLLERVLLDSGVAAQDVRIPRSAGTRGSGRRNDDVTASVKIGRASG